MNQENRLKPSILLGVQYTIDNPPIHDVLRKADDNTVLGIMDLKGMKPPFFFVLRRDEG